MKFKSKPSYLGEKICILPWQMAKQWAVEVDVKNCYGGEEGPVKVLSPGPVQWKVHNHATNGCRKVIPKVGKLCQNLQDFFNKIYYPN